MEDLQELYFVLRLSAHYVESKSDCSSESSSPVQSSPVVQSSD